MAKSRTNCDKGKSVAGGTEAGRRDWTSTAESDNSKMYLSRRFRSKHRFRKPTGFARQKWSQNRDCEVCSPPPDTHGPTGWTWSSFSGLRLRGASVAFRSLNTVFFYRFCAQNMFLDTHIPSLRPLQSKETHIIVRNRVFVRSTAGSGSLSLAQFLSSIHEEEDDR